MSTPFPIVIFLGQSGEFPHWIFLQQNWCCLVVLLFGVKLRRIKLFIPFMHARKGKKIITPSKLTIIYKASKVVNNIIIIIIIIIIPLHCPMEKNE